jgi:hypothetical protein
MIPRELVKPRPIYRSAMLNQVPLYYVKDTAERPAIDLWRIWQC